MSKRIRKDLLVYDVPDDIRNALVADAYAQDKSINDTAVTILCARYKIKHTPSDANFQADSGGDRLSIRGGAKLHRRIDIERARRGGTLRGIVLETLALYYGLKPPPIGRQPRQKKEQPV